MWLPNDPIDSISGYYESISSSCYRNFEIVKQRVIPDWDNTYEGKSPAFSVYMSIVCIHPARVLTVCHQAETERTRFDNAANFRFPTSFNFNLFLFLSNLWKDFSNLNYLVHVSNQISFRWWFYLLLQIKKSRRVGKSRPVCVSLSCEMCTNRMEIVATKAKTQLKRVRPRNFLK